MLTIIKKGMLSTVQDGGRPGYQRFGVPVCGAMDAQALKTANILVSNDPLEAAIEITGGGLALRFDSACSFAYFGCEMSATLDGVPVHQGRAVCAAQGQILTFAVASAGFRSYLAIAGGLALEPVLGSRSTYLKGGFGGFEGRALLEGDRLPLRFPQALLPNIERRFCELPMHSGTVRVVMGPQEHMFSYGGIKAFLGSEYKIDAQSDRMGYRLNGARVSYSKGYDGNIISDGIVMGAVQVSGGSPMIMMADRQTSGGYAKIATVISADLPLLAQLRAGESIRFMSVSADEARKIYIECERALKLLEYTINSPLYL